MRDGLQARQEQRWDDAARAFEAAARLQPNLAEAYANLGLVRQRQGNMAAAVAAFEKALELRPNLPGLRGLLGYGQLMLGRAEAAVANLEQEQRAAPSNPRLNSWLGLAYLESGQHRKAITSLEVARRAQPRDINVLLYLARAYEGVVAGLHDELYRMDREKAREVEPVVKSKEAEGKVGGDRAEIARLEAVTPRDVETVAKLALAYKAVLDDVRAEVFRLDPEKAKAALGGEAEAAAVAAGPERAEPLSRGQRETLVREACTQCHRFPPPSVLPKKAWLGKAEKMFTYRYRLAIIRALVVSAGIFAPASVWPS